MIAFTRIVLLLLGDLVTLALLAMRPGRAIEAENFVLRRQLALYHERGGEARAAQSGGMVTAARDGGRLDNSA